MDGARDPPVRRELEHAADVRPPELHRDRDRRLREARRPPRHRPSTARPSPARRCRSSTPSTASRRVVPPGKAPALLGRRARDDQAGRRDDAGRALRAGTELAFCQPTVVGFLVFHAQDETALALVAVRRPLRRRHAEGEPTARPRRSGACARTASIARCPGLELPVTATTLALSDPRRDPPRPASAFGCAAASTASTRSRLRKLPDRLDDAGEARLRARGTARDRRSRPGPRRTRELLLHRLADPPGQPGLRADPLQSVPLQLP